MKSIRRIHAWLGVLFAPSIIFFALSGTLQLFGLHDTAPGETPGLVAKLGMVHTHQTATVPVRQARPQPAATTAPTRDAEARADRAQPKGEQAKAEQAKGERPTTMPLKLFFALMAISLIASSGLGLWIAFTSKRDRKLHVGLLIAGVVLPIVLLLV